jgi:hypothetical protein
VRSGSLLGYVVCSFSAGNEGFLLDLFGLRQHIVKGKHNLEDPHVAAPLLGQLKGEDGECYHMLLMASVTESGLKIRHWLEQLVIMRERQDRFHGQHFVMKTVRWCRCLHIGRLRVRKEGNQA